MGGGAGGRRRWRAAALAARGSASCCYQGQPLPARRRSYWSVVDWPEPDLAALALPVPDCTGWYGRTSADAERIASGPKRAPGLKLVAVSNGAPSTAALTRSSRGAAASGTCGRLANVRTPA